LRGGARIDRDGIARGHGKGLGVVRRGQRITCTGRVDAATGPGGDASHSRNRGVRAGERPAARVCADGESNRIRAARAGGHDVAVCVFDAGLGLVPNAVPAVSGVLGCVVNTT